MKNEHFVLNRSVIAIAVALAFPVGVALADEVQDLTSPNVSDVSIHIQDYNKVNPLYRYYSGINQSGADYSVDANIVNRDANGDWLKIQARDLGIPGIQEFGISYEKQGDWRAALDYNEITKYSPYTVATGVAGIGSGTLLLPTNVSTAGGPTSLSLERTGTKLSLSKFFMDNLKLNFSISEEDKSGAINSGSNGTARIMSTTAAPATLAGVGPLANRSYGSQFFTPQPEDYQHTQISASVDYFNKTFQLSAGYYGSFFTDSNTALNVQNSGTLPGTGSLTSAIVNGVASTATAAGSPGTAFFAGSYPWVSLPPSNHFQQLYVDGAYAFSDDTHLNFKLTTAQTVQDAAFIPNIGVNGVAPIGAAAYNPAGVVYATGITNNNLAGQIDTNTAAVNLTSSLADNLELLGSWRYEGRADKTPLEAYGGGTTGCFSTTNCNFQNSETVNTGVLELGYRFGDGYKLAGVFNYDGTATPYSNGSYGAMAALAAWRDKVNENTFSATLSKSLSEVINGSATLSHSSRTGSPWELAGTNTASTGIALNQTSMVTAPLEWGDRTRDAAKLMVDWTPIPALSLQVYYQYAEDKYSSQPWQDYNSPTPLTAGGLQPEYQMAQMGLISGKSNLVGLDLSYAINKKWKASAFATYSRYQTKQDETTNNAGAYGDNLAAGVNCSPTTAAQLVNDPTNANTACVPWSATLTANGGVLGASLTGSLANWSLRAKYMYERDTTSYGISYVDTGITSPEDAGAGVLPDTVYTTNRLQLSAVYPYSKATKLRFDYLFDVQTVSDYAYSNGWTRSDGTQIIQTPRQVTQAVGVTLTQSF